MTREKYPEVVLADPVLGLSDPFEMSLTLNSDDDQGINRWVKVSIANL